MSSDNLIVTRPDFFIAMRRITRLALADAVETSTDHTTTVTYTHPQDARLTISFEASGKDSTIVTVRFEDARSDYTIVHDDDGTYIHEDTEPQSMEALPHALRNLFRPHHFNTEAVSNEIDRSIRAWWNFGNKST